MLRSPLVSHIDGVEYSSFAPMTASRILSFTRVGQTAFFQKVANFIHVALALASLFVISVCWLENMFNVLPRYVVSDTLVTGAPSR